MNYRFQSKFQGLHFLHIIFKNFGRDYPNDFVFRLLFVVLSPCKVIELSKPRVTKVTYTIYNIQ